MASMSDFIGPGKVSGSSVAGSATVTPVLPANPIRTKVIFSNNSGTQPWFIKLGAGASLTDFSFRINGGENFVLDYPMHTGSVTGIQIAASGTLMVTEFARPL